MKESHPIKVAEFAKAIGIAYDPAFEWWVPYSLRKRDVILAAVKSRIRNKTRKYGIELPVEIRVFLLNGDMISHYIVAR